MSTIYWFRAESRGCIIV